MALMQCIDQKAHQGVYIVHHDNKKKTKKGSTLHEILKNWLEAMYLDISLFCFEGGTKTVDKIDLAWAQSSDMTQNVK